MKTRSTQRVPWSSDGAEGSSCPEQFHEKQRCWSHQRSTGADPKQGEADESVTVTVQKSHILGKCILSEQCAMLSKRPKNTVACCYETYRVRREGKVESPFAFLFFAFFVVTSQTDKQWRMKRGLIYWGCLSDWNNNPHLQNWGYLVKWEQMRYSLWLNYYIFLIFFVRHNTI